MSDTDLLKPAYFRLPVDREAVAQNWSGRGYSCHDCVDPPGRAWLDFLHDGNEVLTVIEGRLELEVKGHSVFNVHDGTTVWLYGYD